MFEKSENRNLKKLLRIVDRSDEIDTWKQVNRIIEDICEGNPKYSKRQVIEVQIAHLESIINVPFWNHLSLASMLTVAAVALAGNLAGINSMENNIILFISQVYFILLLGASAILLFGMLTHAGQKDKFFLHKILVFMLEEIKEKETSNVAIDRKENGIIAKEIEENCPNN